VGCSRRTEISTEEKCTVYRSIVVGTDGSESAGKAVGRAIVLARLAGAKLHVITATEPLSAAQLTRAIQAVPEEHRFQVNLMREADKVLAGAAEAAAAEGVDVETHPMAADPADAIISVAEQQHADLIVVGNKGMVGTGRFLLGSVPNKISHHAPCDVLIVQTT
jgi:nucleotide-binding universal stress UspA family protein